MKAWKTFYILVRVQTIFFVLIKDSQIWYTSSFFHKTSQRQIITAATLARWDFVPPLNTPPPSMTACWTTYLLWWKNASITQLICIGEGMAVHCHLCGHLDPQPHCSISLPLLVFLVQGVGGEDFEGNVLGDFRVICTGGWVLQNLSSRRQWNGYVFKGFILLQCWHTQLRSYHQ